MTTVVRHQEAHLRRRADLLARLHGLSDRQIKALTQWCQLCLVEQQQRYPSSWSIACPHWSTPQERSAWCNTSGGMAWWHSVYGLQGALTVVIVETRRELQRREASRHDTSILRGRHLHRSLLG
jgi:hypothetical protein